jgi:hypothetical protein
MGEDLAVAVTVARIPFGAPLAHPDPVAPPTTVEQEHRSGRCRSWECEGDEHRYDSHPHRGSAE